ncbi:MAG TPA: TetR/AcrR family transcriptional regulator [Acidimicrobiales bacterium]|jgi:AcrR family transcriptional regulator
MQPRQTQAERSEATRAALLSAARALFAERGYSGASSEAIVTAAGVSRGALQHHFVDKQSLFLAVYEEVESEVVAMTAEAGMAAGHDHPIRMLRVGCDAYLDAVLDPVVQQICAIDGPAVLSPETRNAITDRYVLGLVREVVEQAIAQGEIDDVPGEPLTRMLLAAIVALAQFVGTAEDPAAARLEAGWTIDLVLSSLERRAGE